MGIVVLGAVFVDIKGNPINTFIPNGRNEGRVEQVHGGGDSFFAGVAIGLTYGKLFLKVIINTNCFLNLIQETVCVYLVSASLL